MNTNQQTQLHELSEKLKMLTADIKSTSASNLYLATQKLEGQPLVIVGNQEGLTYLASICLSLAKKMSEQQHYHFDEVGVLSESQEDFVLKFQSTPC